MRITSTLEYNTPKAETGAAILAAASRGTVHLPPGRYLLDKPLVLPAGAGLVGLDRPETTRLMYDIAASVSLGPTQQATSVTVLGARVENLQIDCALPGPGGPFAVGGVVAYWGQSFIRNVRVMNWTNGAAKEGFALFCDGAIESCEVTNGIDNPAAKGPELTAIAGHSIRRCRVDLRGCKQVTHGITLLGGQDGVAEGNTVRHCTVGYYTDSHPILRPLIWHNVITECRMAFQLSGGVAANQSPRLDHCTRSARLEANIVRDCGFGLYVYAPIAYEGGDTTKPWRWHDDTKLVRNDFHVTDYGVRLQAAHWNYLGAFSAYGNLIDIADPRRGLVVTSEHVAGGNLITGACNTDLSGRDFPWAVYKSAGGGFHSWMPATPAWEATNE